MKKRGSRSRGILVALSILSVLFVPVFARTSDILTLLLFGREYFNGGGSSFNRTFSVPTLEGTFSLNVVNGNGSGNNKVPSGIIRINGTQIVGPSELNGGVNQISLPLTNLNQGSNSLTVEFPQPTAGTCISVTVTGDYLLNVTITSPLPDAWVFSDRVTVSGAYASYTTNKTVTVNGVSAAASGGLYTATDVPLISGSNILTATIQTADSIQRQANVSVNVNRPPVANAGQDRNVTVGDNVVLDGRDSYDPEGNPIGYLWSFSSRPAGSSSVFFNPSSVMGHFIPDFPGSYVASLTVSDPHSSGVPDTVNVSAAPVNSPPTAEAGPGQSVVTGSIVQLDSAGSRDPEGIQVSYSWDFLSLPPGSAAALNAPQTSSPTFTADVSGEYVVRLIVSDSQYPSLPDNVTIVASTPNAVPVADAGLDQTVFRNGMIVLDGTVSYDPEGLPIGFSWTVVSQPPGSVSMLENPASPNPTMPADREGEYVFRLVVNDSELQSNPDTVVVTAVNAPPVAIIGPIQEIAAGATLILDGSGSTDANGDPLNFSWTLLSRPEGSTAELIDPETTYPLLTPDVIGDYVVQLVVSDGQAASAPATENVTAWPSNIPVPSVLGMTQAEAENAISLAGLTAGSISEDFSESVVAGRVLSQNPGYGFTAPFRSPVDLVISKGPSTLPPPPNPAGNAPAVDPTVATTMLAATGFLHTGANPIQTGVAPGTIDTKRAAVVRGRVSKWDNTALPGVTITIHNHPEFGRTVSRDDGMFDMAVNGGGHLTVDYQKNGYLPVQRQVNVPWQDYAWAPDISMIPYDNQVAEIDLASPALVGVSRGSEVTDSRGTRQATLFFPQGTTAQMVMPDGSTRSISSFRVRASEYTVGPAGPSAMPAILPPSSAYTYATELSLDEAVAAGATEVIFDRPVYHYVENFIGIPVGMAVPSGYFDRRRGIWVPSENGRVIKILSVVGGMANLDSDGDGTADDSVILATLGITDSERVTLGSLYLPDTTLWRTPIRHFSPWDQNLPYGVDNNAVNPNGGSASKADRASLTPDQTDFICNSSIIGCQGQDLGESIPVAGTPFSLNYLSTRTFGRRDKYTVDIPLSGQSVPDSLLRIDLEILVAGRRFAQQFPPAPNRYTSFTWDGMDAYGRKIQGEQPIKVRVGFAYPTIYREPGNTDPSFAVFGGALIEVAQSGSEVISWQEWTDFVGTWDARAQGLGGWTLSAHHAYSPQGNVLLLGTGERRDAKDFSKIITSIDNSIVPNGDDAWMQTPSFDLPTSIAFAPDGSLFVADQFNDRIMKVGPDGRITKVAGGNGPGFSGDGGPAVQAMLDQPWGIAIAQDGSLYFSDVGNNRIRRVGPDNIITTVVGTGPRSEEWFPKLGGFGGDGGPAVEALLAYPTAISLGPDGSLYIADTDNYRIRRVGLDNTISTFAGIGPEGEGASGDGGPATEARIDKSFGLAVAPDGSVYIADSWNSVVRRVDPQGIIKTVAGIDNNNGFNGDGMPANNAFLSNPVGLAIGADGSLFIADSGNYRIRRVGPDRNITTVAGIGQRGNLPIGDGGPATLALLYMPQGVAVGPDGVLYIADTYGNLIRKVTSPMPGFGAADYAIASADGREVYRFDQTGKHLQTIDAVTGSERFRFVYDPTGFLAQVVDADNNATIIERDGNGNPVAIVAPGGQRTTFTLDQSEYGYLASVTGPSGDNVQLNYKHEDDPENPDVVGLLTRLVDRRGFLHTYGYDPMGRLIRDDDPAGGYKILDRTDEAGGKGYSVKVTTALGRETIYGVYPMAAGGMELVNTLPGGAQSASRDTPNGVSTVWSTDNTITEVMNGPDPRFGMQAPISKSSIVSTPNGLVRTITASKTADLSSPGDMLSLISQIDTMVVNGRTYTTAYDNASKQSTSTTPEGRQSFSVIDGKGKPISVQSDNSVLPMIFSYDEKGRIKQYGQGINLRTNEYDDLNRLWKTTDALNHTTEYGYDNASRVKMVKLPSGRTYEYRYDGAGNRTKVIMPNLEEHLLGYSPVNLDNSYLPPGNPSYTRIYSLDREWKQTTLPLGRSILAEYDPVSAKLLSVSYPEGTITYGYADNTGRIYQMTRSGSPDNAVQGIGYDYDGFLITKIAFSGTSSGEYRYIYDNNFFLTSVILDNVSTLLSRDADGLLKEHGPFSIPRTGPAGAPGGIGDNTLSVAITYDTYGRLATRTHTVGTQQVYQLVLAYDNVGRIETKTETLAGMTGVFGYKYDLDGQLSEVRKDGILIEQYNYDNNANRNLVVTQNPSRNLSPGDFDYDPQDRLGRMGLVSYVFDTDGYLTQRGLDNLAYSARGELLSADVGGQTIRYHYDGTGRRAGKTDSSGTTQYLYGNLSNPFQVTASRAPDNTLTVYYYDDFGAMYAFERGGARYYVGSDHLGTPKVVMDNTGNIVRQIEYDSWGVKTNDTNPSFDLPVGFAGGIPDDATGLVRFGYRDYEPASGRWAAKDPIFFEGGQANLYAYVGNSPISWKDSMGLGGEYDPGGVLFRRFPVGGWSGGGGGSRIPPPAVVPKLLPNDNPWVSVTAKGGQGLAELIKDWWSDRNGREMEDAELWQDFDLFLALQKYNQDQLNKTINNTMGFCPLNRKR